MVVGRILYADKRQFLAGLVQHFQHADNDHGHGDDAEIGRRQEAGEDDGADKSGQPDSPAK